jgi:hypothetical protein
MENKAISAGEISSSSLFFTDGSYSRSVGRSHMVCYDSMDQYLEIELKFVALPTTILKLVW